MQTADPTAFPRQFARTRRFSLGVPSRFTVSPDGERVLFVRSVSGSDPRTPLWLYENGKERILADPAELAGPGPERLSDEERTRRERDRVTAAGVVAYATDRAVRLVAFTLGGALWAVRTDGGAPWHIPTAGPATDPRPSPDGTLIAYVTGGTLRAVRTDGTRDRALARPEAADVTYGLADHVAAESIGRSRGYWWSPTGDALLVARVDAAMVTRWYIGDPADPARPPRTIRYPAAGTANAETSLHLVTVDGVRTPVQLPARAPEDEAPKGEWQDLAFEYAVSAEWESAGPLISLQTRDQRTMWVLRADPVTGAVEPLSRLTDDHWVEFPPGAPFHTASGALVLPCVQGDTRSIRIGEALSPAGLQIREVLGAVGERVYFTASEEPTEVHVWSYEGAYEEERGFVRLTDKPGVHSAAAGGDTLVLDSATPDGRQVTVLRGGKPVGRIAVLAEEPLIKPRPVHLTLGERELRSRLHLPSWYEEGSGRKLPVLLSPYAGPGMQVVTQARAWYTAVCQWFAEQGFAVLATDGRGTPGRGVEWQRAIVGDRLAPALADQIDALHAAAERYDALDLTRVGIRGWSFSGYLAAGAVLRRPDVFHAAVAGAPPTDRRLYDTYWEERYLGHPEVQPEGYARSSPLSYAEHLSYDHAGTAEVPVRPLLLIHGLADDNVVPAHTFRLSAALFAAGRPHSVLPLPGTGHLVAREGVADGLLLHELGFLKKSLDSSPSA
ncbi:prolyl oligopeptidase family serine peptidase [Streptomyces sp. GMY02]|uniref:S9 family peptidase n=1 Tax=Streptomyces sp. GMY02 TaxID=1333528 RepID=UPI001C2C57ED|nr:prolyl oligopeptidase family serine peptidase [Streptomyces sp. GMY02]QXE37962.1 prolyl oligopeptidase family serine peptidase [Streptomyces sp. GMY02]